MSKKNAARTVSKEGTEAQGLFRAQPQNSQDAFAAEPSVGRSHPQPAFRSSRSPIGEELVGLGE
ncbi:hypothetical protein O7A70_32410 [Mesorhizobium sp. Cs1299R1N1]|uniref:hypothetical protein n=1 Tax=Mesorhizobium sp. Cs1299R1N1 TaxID=3015172 RepID=UPI00301C957E